MTGLTLVILTDPGRRSEAELLADELQAAGFERPALLDCTCPIELAASLANPNPWFAFPLESCQDGALQGLLEFLGIPHAGADQTAMVLVADRAYAAAVAGAPVAVAGPPAQIVQLAVTGTDQLQIAGPPTSPELRAQAADFYRCLGLSGWCLLDLAVQAAADGRPRISLHRAQPWPPLEPAGAFRQALRLGELPFGEALRQLVCQGQARLAAEKSLRKHYKDGI